MVFGPKNSILLSTFATMAASDSDNDPDYIPDEQVYTDSSEESDNSERLYSMIDLKEEPPFEFTPEIKVEDVKSGVIYLQITNCESMWEKNRFESMHDVCFEFTYKRIKTNEHDTNTEIDNIWRNQKS